MRRRGAAVRTAAGGAAASTHRLGLAAAALLLGVAAASGAEAAPRADSAEAVERCVEENFPDASSVQTVRMDATDRHGTKRSWRGTVYWKRFEDGLSRVLLRIEDPPELKTAGLLMIESRDREQDMFLYLPELRKSRRVTSRTLAGPLFGTDFTYEQFERLYGLYTEGESQLAGDAQVADRATYVVETRPKPGGDSGFSRIVSYVDHETCVPLKVEFYEEGEQLRRVLEADPSQVTLEGDSHVPRRSVMKDLWDRSQTELVVEAIEVNAEINPATFSQRSLEAHGH